MKQRREAVSRCIDQALSESSNLVFTGNGTVSRLLLEKIINGHTESKRRIRVVDPLVHAATPLPLAPHPDGDRPMVRDLFLCPNLGCMPFWELETDWGSNSAVIGGLQRKDDELEGTLALATGRDTNWFRVYVEDLDQMAPVTSAKVRTSHARQSLSALAMSGLVALLPSFDAQLKFNAECFALHAADCSHTMSYPVRVLQSFAPREDDAGSAGPANDSAHVFQLVPGMRCWWDVDWSSQTPLRPSTRRAWELVDVVGFTTEHGLPASCFAPGEALPVVRWRGRDMVVGRRKYWRRSSSGHLEQCDALPLRHGYSVTVPQLAGMSINHAAVHLAVNPQMIYFGFGALPWIMGKGPGEHVAVTTTGPWHMRM